MLSSRKSDNLTNKIHERSLRIIIDDKESDFQTLLENHNQLIIHQRNWQALIIEKNIYKILNAHTHQLCKTCLCFEKMYTILEMFR